MLRMLAKRLGDVPRAFPKLNLTCGKMPRAVNAVVLRV